MNIPKDLKYTKTHEWARREGSMVTVGISDYAQHEISDVVFVELPKAGKPAEAGKPIAVVESVKAAFDIYAPVSGKIVKVNTAVEGDPGIVNQDCYGEGWFAVIEVEDASQWDSLMDAAAYENNLNSGVS